MTRLREADLLLRRGTPATPASGFVRLYVDLRGRLFMRNGDGSIVGPIGDVSGVLLADGSVALAGNLAVDPGVTIDGRDISIDGAALDALPAFVIDTVEAATLWQYLADPGAAHMVVAGDHMKVFGATNPAANLVVDVPAGLPLGTSVIFEQRAIGFPILLTASGGMTLGIPLTREARTVSALYARVKITVLESTYAMVEGDLAGQAERLGFETLSGTPTHDWTPADPYADVLFVENTTGGVAVVTGLNMGPTQVEGRRVRIFNKQPSGPDESIAFDNDNVNSLVTNRIWTPGGNGIPLANQGGVILRYTTQVGAGTPGRWMAETIEITF